MIDKNLAAYKIPYGMYIAIGGDPEREFTSIADIYTEINKIYSSIGNRVDIEPLKVEFTTNGTKVFNEDVITGYKPVEVSVNVDVGDVYDDGYNTGVADQKGKLESISITENGTYNKEDGYNEVKVNVQGKLEVPFEEIGYPTELKDAINNELNNKPLSDLEYSKILYDKWNPNSTSLSYKGDIKLVYCPLIDTSNVTYMSSTFNGCTLLTTIPLLDTSKVTDMKNAFRDCTSLTTIPLLDTSSVTAMTYMCAGCTSLTSFPAIDTSSVTDMFYMFNGCTSLTTIPLLDTSKVEDMGSMFSNCTSLTTIPLLDTSKAKDMGSMFSSCTSLTSLPLLDVSSVTSTSKVFGYSDLKKLTYLGGFKNLGMQPNVAGTNDNYFLYKAPNLTYESVMNVINNLYDRASAGYSVLTLKFATKTLALLSEDDIAIATNKGWTLS